MPKNQTRVAIIGGGPGGYAAAFMAADLGLDVTLIELEKNPGGVCLYRGCIPSKAYLHVAKVLTDAREAAYWGISFPEPQIDVNRLRASKNEIVEKMTSGLGQLTKARNIRYLRGRASFAESTKLQVVDDKGKQTDVETDYTIIASGSRPAVLPNILIETDRLMNSTSALDMTDIPKTLLVVGGGYIGLELGSVYAALGTKVTVVEMTPTLLPGADADLVRILSQRMEQVMERILLNARVVDIQKARNGLKVTFDGPGIENSVETFDKVLVSIGRKPNSSGLGLNSTKVEVDKQGFITIDDHCRTADPAIFAIGDVAGEPMLAHKATHQGRVAAQVIAGEQAAFEPNAIPAVVFTDPEVAWCGLTENQAQAEGREIKVARFPWGASGRAASIGRSDGMTKLITDPATNQVLGVGIVGPNAGELIAEGVLAIEMGASAEDVGLTIHAHPTLGETIMETAEIIFGKSTHVYRPAEK